MGLSGLQDTTVGEGNGTPFQYSCLENPMDGGNWKAAVHGVAEGQTQLRDFTFTFHFHTLEKEMATHSRVLAWRIPGMGEPGGAAVYGVAQSWTRLKRLSSSRSSNNTKRCLNWSFRSPDCEFFLNSGPQTGGWIRINWIQVVCSALRCSSSAGLE